MIILTKRVAVSGAVGLICIICMGAAAPTEEMSTMMEIKSAYSFNPTVERLTKSIESAGMTIFASIDHAAGAESVGMHMPPTVVLIYGNPRGGTPIMQTAPQTALDLPLRVLVREDGNGHTLVAFHPVAPALQQAGVPADLARHLEPAQNILVQAVKP
jgi:uncharacterized protein (DUF302 family)